MTDFGRDVSTFTNGDLDPAFRWISGRRVVAERVARRLYTDVDLLEYAPDGCLDIRAFLSGGVDNATLLRLASRITAIAERDESVATADATVSWNDATQALKVRIALETEEGPFSLVLAITAVTLELLGVE